MAVACSTSAFKVPLDEALAEVAGLGFGHVDLISIEGWNHVEPEELVTEWEVASSEVTESLRRHGLEPVALNVAVGDLYDRRDEIRSERLEKVGAVARLMEHLGVPVASFYPGYMREEVDWDEALEGTLATWREMRSPAREWGVRFVLEAHKNTPFETLDQIARLLEADADLALAYDPSHFVMQSLDVRETEPLLERTEHVHLRDAGPEKMQRPLGEGTVDFEWILDALRERGYGGHFSIEYLGGRDRDVTGDIAELKRLVETHLSV